MSINSGVAAEVHRRFVRVVRSLVAVGGIALWLLWAPRGAAETSEARRIDRATRGRAVEITGREVIDPSVRFGIAPNVVDRLALFRRLPGGVLIETRAVTEPPPHPTRLARRYLPATLSTLGRKRGTAPGGRPDEWRCAVFIQILSKPLSWNDALAMYTAPVAVGLESLTPSVTPEPGFKATVLVSVENAEVERNVFVLTGPQALETQLRTRLPGTVVTIRAQLGESQVDDVASAEFRLGGLQVIAADSAIDGFGRGRTAITVQRVDPRGAPLAADRALDVTLWLEGSGQLASRELTLPAGQAAAKTELRAGERGGATVYASGGGFKAAAHVDYLSEALGELRAEVTYPRILALGFGRTPLIVTRLDPGGRPLVGGEMPLTLQLVAGSGHFHPESGHVIEAGEPSLTVGFRSDGFGAATIVARSGKLLSNQVPIAFMIPWLPMLCALAGSLVGGTLRWLRSNTERPPLKRVLLEAALTALGLVAAVLIGVRVEWLPAEAADTAAGALVVGFASGFLGVIVLEGLLRLTKPAPPAAV